ASNSPTFTQVASYPFRQPTRIFYSPYNRNEIWVTSNGNGLRVGQVNNPDNVTYRFPYFHTAATNVIYCVASNSSSQSASVTFTPRTSGLAFSTSSFPAINLGILGGNMTDMYTFNQNSASSFVGGVNASIVGPDTSTKGSFYGVDISFGSAATNNGTLDCSNIVMTCFQGTTNPKRNVHGYQCFSANGIGHWIPY
ncbi:MAG: hypothetical protein HQK89_08760, partial [Nitrospirae bacterium]|nr:hypothetical protein [Nitrospirota bacterium]